MTDAGETIGAKEPAGFERGFDGHQRRQARFGLALTPAQRLRWLEQTMEELRPLVGRARLAKPSSSKTGGPAVS
jgi:hypothetical protein